MAAQLTLFAGLPDIQVLGLPRGGVPVAYEVARALSAPLDVYVVRKLGVPGREEVAMGALASGGSEFIDARLVAALGISESEIEQVRRRERLELKRREAVYRGDSAGLPSVEGRVVMLVDDGIATGATLFAGLLALRELRPAQLVAVAPIGLPDGCQRVMQVCDSLVCPWRPAHFGSVGQAYENFDATSDEEVVSLLGRARQGD